MFTTQHLIAVVSQAGRHPPREQRNSLANSGGVADPLQAGRDEQQEEREAGPKRTAIRRAI